MHFQSLSTINLVIGNLIYNDLMWLNEFSKFSGIACIISCLVVEIFMQKRSTITQKSFSIWC